MNDLTGFRNFRSFQGIRTKNGRTLRAGAFARSDNPRALPEEDMILLREADYRIVVDLRRDEERAARPDLLAAAPGFEYHPLTLNSKPYLGRYLLSDSKMVARAYFSELPAAAAPLRKIFHLFAEAENGVLFHCEAGKDRTGVVAALLLTLVGAEEAEIIDDYAASFDRLYGEGADVFLADRELIPKAEVMEYFLDFFYAKYISSESFFAGIGLSESDREMIKRKFVSR
ncbi:MAG: tyrosine-protein phosphatase [Bacillota bacterium]|jgi:protein-tyrosine phosphatase